MFLSKLAKRILGLLRRHKKKSILVLILALCYVGRRKLTQKAMQLLMGQTSRITDMLQEYSEK